MNTGGIAQRPAPATGDDPSAAGPAAREGAPHREPWQPPRGRDLLAGVALAAVLVAILVVFTHDVPRASRAGAAEPLPVRPGAAAPASPVATAWSDVPVTRSVADLPREVAGPVEAGLAAARDRLDRCLAVARRRAAGSEPAPAPASRAPAEVVLRLATRASAVHVEGVEVTSPGSSPTLVDCARRMLDGAVMPGDAVVPGRRQRLAVALE